MRHFLNTVISFFRIPAAVAEQAAMLVTRLVIGQAFMLTGWGKLHSLEGVTKYFTDLGIPMPGANALLVANLEFFGASPSLLGWERASLPLCWRAPWW